MRLRILHDNEVALEVKNGAVVCSISEISRLLQVDRDTVRKTIRKHSIEPAGLRKKTPHLHPVSGRQKGNQQSFLVKSTGTA